MFLLLVKLGDSLKGNLMIIEGLDLIRAEIELLIEIIRDDPEPLELGQLKAMSGEHVDRVLSRVQDIPKTELKSNQKIIKTKRNSIKTTKTHQNWLCLHSLSKIGDSPLLNLLKGLNNMINPLLP